MATPLPPLPMPPVLAESVPMMHPATVQKWDRILIPSPAKRLMTSFCIDRTQSARTDHEPVRPRTRPRAVCSMSGVPANRPGSARDDNLVGDGGQGGQEVDGLRPRADGEGDGIAAGCRVRPSDRLPEAIRPRRHRWSP